MAGPVDLADIKDVTMFADHVGSVFKIETGPDRFAEATLIGAQALGPQSARRDANARQPFALLFNVQDDLPQQTYNLIHDRLGVLPLFLVPVGSGRMESVFN